MAGTFTVPIRIKAPNKSPLKFRRKWSVGVSRDCPIFWVPPIISGMGIATNFKFCRNIHGVDRNKKPMKNFGNNSRGRSQGVPKTFRAPMYRIFAIAQLSCFFQDAGLSRTSRYTYRDGLGKFLNVSVWPRSVSLLTSSVSWPNVSVSL